MAWRESRRMMSSSILAAWMKALYWAEVRRGSLRSRRKCLSRVVTAAISLWKALGSRKSTCEESVVVRM